MSHKYSTQNDLLLKNLITFYNKDDNLQKLLVIINGKSKISLRIVDWFSTNYAKQYWTTYSILKNGETKRFNVYIDYKLQLKSYSKRRFDPFCRWDRVTIPYQNNTSIQTTIGQLNFFKWALENNIIKYVEENYQEIEKDMNVRNSTAKKKGKPKAKTNTTRKKREELSVSAVKTVKKEEVEIVVKFD